MASARGMVWCGGVCVSFPAPSTHISAGGSDGRSPLLFFKRNPSPSNGRCSRFLGTSDLGGGLGQLVRPPRTTQGGETSSEGKTPIDYDDEEGDNVAHMRLEHQKSGRRRAFGGGELRLGVASNGAEIIAACIVGLLTGVGVVLFNNLVHEIRDFFWDGIPSRGASWLREEPLGEVWQRVICIPLFGGLMVGMLNNIRSSLEIPAGGTLKSNVGSAIRPFLKAISASITLGTGNSLGPEGPSVEIGASIAKGVGYLLERNNGKSLSLVAAGSAAGISSGFNAAVAGCFFAVESVLWPSAGDSSSSLTNSTSMVILSSVIASVISELGLGSVPAFRVPEYDFRSPSELPLYLLLGILCGLVSLTLSRCTSYALVAVEYVQRTTGITKAVFPALGGLTVGLIALAYPEVLYWGFENVDILLESRPFVKGLPADLLLQLVGAKIVATSVSRAFGLVGGYYAPSLFIGAATGMAYGKVMGLALSAMDPLFQLSILEVASPQAYGLVGMAATLAGVCQVPLTSVLLLFELTQDYRIVLPLLGAVGLSSWIASTQNRTSDDSSKVGYLKMKTNQQPMHSLYENQVTSNSTSSAKASHSADLCDLESSLCVYKSEANASYFMEKLTVSQAMRKRYVTVSMSTSLAEAATLMLVEKLPCAIIVDNDNFLEGLLELEDIQDFNKVAKARGNKNKVEGIAVSQIYHLDELIECHKRGFLIGLLDRESISITCRLTRSFGCSITTKRRRYHDCRTHQRRHLPDAIPRLLHTIDPTCVLASSLHASRHLHENSPSWFAILQSLLTAAYTLTSFAYSTYIVNCQLSKAPTPTTTFLSYSSEDSTCCLSSNCYCIPADCIDIASYQYHRLFVVSSRLHSQEKMGHCWTSLTC